MMIAIIGALGAALCWSFSSLISVYPAQILGAAAFNRLRMVFVTLLLSAAVTVTGEWDSLAGGMMVALILSGVIGIFIGDTALFTTLRRMGPRRTAILFAMNAPIATLLGFLFLNERLVPMALGGCVLVVAGVVLAIVYGKRKDQLHQWESIRGTLLAGILFGLLAATAQAVGLILSKPVLAQGADPVAASAVRVGVSAVGLMVLAQLPLPQFKPQGEMSRKVFWFTLASGFFGMGVGMTLLMVALRHGDTGIVATLSATSPALMLPLIWIKTKERPAAGAWCGALAVAVGTGMIFMV
ncbi:DMT family transporter [Aestuariispira insulae]|nr:DMT family transporter [Aestuariispira insulae]